MKKLFCIGIFLMLFATVNAQEVTLEKRYEYSTTVVKLETLGYKYYLMDVPAEECRIYNLDHSVFKTINCNIPNGFYLSDVKFVSEKLFDTDAGIELLCTYYKYNTSKLYYEYDSKIINDDGSQITFIDGALYNYINRTDENTYKLFSYCFNYSVSPEKVWTNIYNLPGSTIMSAVSEEYKPEIEMSIFPNPASQTVNVSYNLPDNVSSGILHLLDNNGKSIQQFLIDDHTNHLELDVSNFSPGIYLYFIEYENTKTVSKKLVIKS